MVLAIALVVLVLGSLLFHLWSPWYYTPLASNWKMVDDLTTTTVLVTGIVFIIVNLFVAYCVLQFRNRQGSKAAYEPENHKLELWLSVLTAIGVAGLLTPGLFAWAKIVDVPKDAQVVEALSAYVGITLPKDSIASKMRPQHDEREPLDLHPEVDRLCREMWDSFAGYPEI